MIRIRKANPGDEYIIQELVGKVLNDYDLKLNTLTIDKDITDVNKNYFSKNGWFAILEYDAKPVGTYGIYRIDDNVCELRKMYLLNEFQGKGLGKMMMEDAVEIARRLGYKKMILETNMVLYKAVQLYQKFGFIEYKPSHLSERCDFAMWKEL
jgi:putative acetyltransferase